MTVERLRQKRGIEARIAQISEEMGLKLEGSPRKNLKKLILDGIAKIAEPEKSYMRTLMETYKLAQDPECKILLLETEPLFTGGYKANKPAKLPCYDLNSHASLQEGKHFVHSFLQARDRVEFPNRRAGFSWAPEITAERADKRKRLILEVNLVVGTILAADEDYMSQITINGFNPTKKPGEKYRPGMRAVLGIPSVEHPDVMYTLELLAMPVFPKNSAGSLLTDHQRMLTFNFCPYCHCEYPVPFNMSFSRNLVSDPEGRNIQDELVIDHHAKAGIERYISWIRDESKDFRIPNLIPNAPPGTIDLFWNLYEKGYAIDRSESGAKVRPLDMWMLNRLLLNYEGYQNEQRTRKNK